MVRKRNEMPAPTEKNGYNPSILPTEAGRCYVCGRCGYTQRHEIFAGSHRTASKRYGLWINVCPVCHSRVQYGGDIVRNLREVARRAVISENHWSNEDFYNTFGRYNFE